MDIHSNLEYLCRVCAVNTKSKNSVPECVYILKTADLKDKLDKYLYLKISENDSLPKVLCKSCFRQVEATAALSKIAKHTQEVFRDFLLSNLPKGPTETTNTSEFTSQDYVTNKNPSEKCKNDKVTAPTVFYTPLLQPLTTASRKDEVIVNVSVADPLTRDNQQKMISNSQRRQSLLLDSRFTPKSIAQQINKKTAYKLIAPKPTQPIATTNTTNLGKTTTTTPALNFFPVKPQQPQQQTSQITTFSSGGYVIGRTNNEKDDSKMMTVPLAATADNILQQKRKNLVKALNNIKANNHSGQISLLKSSQQKQTDVAQAAAKAPLTEVINQPIEDELPNKIIIAAPKNKMVNDKVKREPLNLSSKLSNAPAIPVKQVSIARTASSIAAVVQKQEQPVFANNTHSKAAFPEDILLGRVIRDMDLLKLILKALKWPVSKQNLELQLQRLKNSKFTDIMSDPNLLQDTDLTQLLGPYLAPVLLAAQTLHQQQQNQQQQVLKNQNVASSYATPQKVSVLEAAYRLPPETSVQLVPAVPEEQEPNPSPPLTILNSAKATVKRERQKEMKTGAVPQKRQRRAAAQRARDSILISDEEIFTEEYAPKKSRQRPAKTAANMQIDFNTDFMSQLNLLAGSGGVEANDALLALLQRQKAAIMKDKKVQQRRRNSVANLTALPPSEFDALIDLDEDIVLVEPVSTTTRSLENLSTTFSQEQVAQKVDELNTFVMPPVPLITRPIIKRRKTVIHSSRGRLDMSADKVQPQIPSSLSKEKLLEETINEVASGIVTANPNNNASQNNNPAKITTSENAPLSISSTNVTPQQKKLQNKATLGQQLLEAIGLQKSTKITGTTQSEVATSSSTITVQPNSKQSIQQIRSALKKSLKQAQEQQQQRKKDLSANNTIIQDADSTTKSAVKEIVVVEGKGNKTDADSSMVDVEEQIDKVTLMVRNNDNNSTCKQSAMAATEKEELKETKKSALNKVQERRRIIPTLGARGAGARNVSAFEAKVKTQKEEQEKEDTVANNETAEENEKSEKYDTENANISSSSVAVNASLNETTGATKNEVTTPKRRGRKRLIDKQNWTDLEEANKNEEDNKTPHIITERSLTFDKTKEEEETETISNIKTEEEEVVINKTGRPARQSKTQSKYYKGPEELTQSRRSLPSRTTRNR